jgi:hypothetical protein
MGFVKGGTDTPGAMSGFGINVHAFHTHHSDIIMQIKQE